MPTPARPLEGSHIATEEQQGLRVFTKAYDGVYESFGRPSSIVVDSKSYRLKKLEVDGIQLSFNALALDPDTRIYGIGSPADDKEIHAEDGVYSKVKGGTPEVAVVDGRAYTLHSF